MKSLVFDLDGTLADTSKDLICAANYCFTEKGISPPLDPEIDKLTALLGGKAMLKLGYSRLEDTIPDAQIEEQYQVLLGYYESSIDTYTKLYDMVPETLVALKAQGWLLGVCTNKPERLAIKLLASLGILDEFEALTGADTYAFRKPDPRVLIRTIEKMGGSSKKAIMVGDSKTDLNTGRAAGIPVFLVGFDRQGQKATELQPDEIFMSYQDFLIKIGEYTKSW